MLCARGGAARIEGAGADMRGDGVGEAGGN